MSSAQGGSGEREESRPKDVEAEPAEAAAETSAPVAQETSETPAAAPETPTEEPTPADEPGQAAVTEPPAAMEQAAAPEPAPASEDPAPPPRAQPPNPDGEAKPQRTFTPDFLTELFRNPLDPGYADAAARKAAGNGAVGVPKKILSGVSALTLVALGFLLVVAYQQTVADEPARTQARDTLIEQVQSRRENTTDLSARADQLRSEVARLREQQLGGAALAELQEAEAQTGLAPARGPGTRVTVGDGPSPIDPVTGERSTEGRVRDTDLQRATNALWAGGAEAVAINGQRLTATSTIRQAGEAILVDFRPVTSPYQIVAIGPDALQREFRDGVTGKFFRALNSQFGMSFDVARIGDVTVEAATEPNLRQASPSPQASVRPTSSPSEGGR